ncbi:alpha-amylase [Pustulibacterium marinum]|uniref:Alpha-amylase n=1 Tax=Pustulibacterium marinum TaxID=1224947 RepID=A0A1I7FT04_9FLAO|nr:alpha-amylase family glycosyl hydrolase [Pustulibacterium marinum]SFU39349.1 alpha-amylase [Pustulibacterium marinum]
MDTTENSNKDHLKFIWEGANVYFLITDRFCNGNSENDINFDRNKSCGKLRNFMGGDLQGITQKIKEGYFTNLGINAIWFTPIVEQIHDCVDEGSGNSYGFHGYWAKDWTNIDPNFGTKEDLHELVKTAHEHGIRLLMDVVINHTGPVTEKDPVWPDDWVRTGPVCSYDSYDTTTDCVLVKNLPDIKTENNNDVELPNFLIEKWKREDRLDYELQELDDFFTRTGYPRAPKYYIIKWLTNYIKEFGIDGFRVDTVKHVEEDVWSILRKEADFAFDQWKNNNPDQILDDNKFFMVGEVYGYNIHNGKQYDFGDQKVNYFDHGFNALINFQFKYDAEQDYESIFRRNSEELATQLKGYTVLNYTSSHDDETPFDKERKRPFNAATKLLLSPGISQIYYGDESARPLIISDAQGDANLRSFMNWDCIENDSYTKNLLGHYQKLGKFRAQHPTVGAGVHEIINESPYIFKRTFSSEKYDDKVVIGLDVPEGPKKLPVGDSFINGTLLNDTYSNTTVEVKDGFVQMNTPFSVVLLEPIDAL